ncbi:hypothetical protein EDB92DRAFT_1986939 [Lactarius akahatsu]|uniref:Uncharacterized protein n=1 Tax=Lactarius akahatsu TaxID=416441 RepID=A0AAD4QBE0_9AGAM|nr:hypothetical protein EDB92DRAFT_1986939 [Lactarius akahatsu]
MWADGGVTAVEEEVGAADVKALGCETEVIELILLRLLRCRQWQKMRNPLEEWEDLFTADTEVEQAECYWHLCCFGCSLSEGERERERFLLESDIAGGFVSARFRYWVEGQWAVARSTIARRRQARRHQRGSSVASRLRPCVSAPPTSLKTCIAFRSVIPDELYHSRNPLVKLLVVLWTGEVTTAGTNEDVAPAESAIFCDVAEEAQAAIEAPTGSVTRSALWLFGVIQKLSAIVTFAGAPRDTLLALAADQ